MKSTLVDRARRAALAIPESRRAPILWAVRPLAFRGDRLGCPVCEGRFGSLMTHRGVPDVRCPRCGSMARHRGLWMFLRSETDLLTRPGRVLHVAPEFSIARHLRSQLHLEHVTADLMSDLADVKCDIEEMPFEDASFDVVLCNHVLEHVSDDARAMREILRVLRPGGWASLLVPIGRDQETTFEDPAIRSSEDRMAAYGQEDHSRLYGRDYPERLRAAGFEVEQRRYIDELPGEVVELYALRSHSPRFDEDTYFIARRPA